MTAFLIKQGTMFMILYGFQFLIGTFVVKHNLRVNYARKIVHFMSFITPMAIEVIVKSSTGYNAPIFIVGLLLNCLIMLIYIKPIREKSVFVQRMFTSFDRPEDRPHTLLWLNTQLVAGYIVLAPCFLFFQSIGYGTLAFIPVLINGLGDGLAEPVGIRFGKHKYRVNALFTKKKYTRSIEGSLCVFLSAVLLLLVFSSSFTGIQLIVALLVLPIAMTLAEAFSPHTIDTPFILIVGYAFLYMILSIG
ncbi:diacylglycerol/polyprenol kinase family protein [Paenibacillus durus]|uniref:Phosphatidate cytidylyltransferase n=1 Tax=Paenibacillus durus TaxID=44251 RepID=A0A089HKH2_PAEDU|nr:hypothetical protein [Paenibacillus durus]AIQ12426.1 hypothetical protein PDUR_11255 [Paenibacillus durus]